MQTSQMTPAAPHKHDSAPQIVLGPMRSPQDAVAFRTLNEEWITRYFVLEEKDRLTLGDPYGTIVARGGQVLMPVPMVSP